MIKKIFDGEMFIRSLSTTLLQIFLKIILNLKLIAQFDIDPDNYFQMKHLSYNALAGSY